MITQRIVVAGGTGFLGGVLSHYFLNCGYEVIVLTRGTQSGNAEISHAFWDGRSLDDWAAHLNGSMALINLAGASVNCRYHARNKSRIMASRIESTRTVGRAIALCNQPPRVWLNSSTATIYRHTFGPAWDESGEIGAHLDAKDAFSVEVATAWEREFEQAPTPATRKVALRSAMVLGLAHNSVFPMLRRLVRFGLGGRMGSGHQYVSWIHEMDFCRAVQWAIDREHIHGVVNVAAPNPLSNKDMMDTLREVVGIRVGLPATRWMLEVGAFLMRTETELVIKSRRVIPGLLLRDGFEFQFGDIRSAFEDLHRRVIPRIGPWNSMKIGHAAGIQSSGGTCSKRIT